MAKRTPSRYALCIGDQLRGKKCKTKEQCQKAFKAAVKVCKLKK